MPFFICSGAKWANDVCQFVGEYQSVPPLSAELQKPERVESSQDVSQVPVSFIHTLFFVLWSQANSRGAKIKLPLVAKELFVNYHNFYPFWVQHASIHVKSPSTQVKKGNCQGIL
jgi:hypothetical protein